MGKVQLCVKSSCEIFAISSASLNIPTRGNISRHAQRAIPNGCSTMLASKLISGQLTKHWALASSGHVLDGFQATTTELDVCGLTADMVCFRGGLICCLCYFEIVTILHCLCATPPSLLQNLCLLHYHPSFSAQELLLPSPASWLSAADDQHYLHTWLQEQVSHLPTDGLFLTT